MVTLLGFSLLLAIIWILITAQVSLQSFLIGFVLSLALFAILKPKNIPIYWKRIPGQSLALIKYILEMYINIFVSSLDIARRALSPNMNLQPGIVAIPIHDPQEDATIAALSANSISLAPGELVIEIEDNQTLYIHTLNVDHTLAHASDQQKRRVLQLKRILGKEVA